jgi:hypothetical protein
VSRHHPRVHETTRDHSRRPFAGARAGERCCGNHGRRETPKRSAIIAAFGDPAAAGPCLIVRLAASDHAYGDVRFRNTHSCQRWGFNGTNVLKLGSAGHWKVLFEGSSYHCPLPKIPVQVQRDLSVCPS